MGKKTRGAAKGQSRPSSSASNSSPSAIERNDLTSIVLNSMEAAADKMGLCEDEKTKYLSCARILVIEVVHQSVFGIVNYRRLAGEMGGLNPIKRPYIKRIILAVDGPEGVYGAAHLDRNVHYQIGIEELADYFDDLHRHKFPVYNAASAPPPEMDCCVLCLPDQSHVLKDEYFSLGATDFCSDDCKELVKELCPKKIYKFLIGVKDDTFDQERGNLCLNYGWLALNSTDSSRDDLCGFASPTLSKADGKGWSSTRDRDIPSAMAAMTKLTDHTTNILGLDNLFGRPSDARVTQYAARIHSENRAESVTFSLAAAAVGDQYLLAHLDHLNDFDDGYQWNMSYYGYHRTPGSTDLRRMHTGIYSRRVCGTTSERSGRSMDLYRDLVNFLDVLPSRRVKYSPEAVVDGAEWDREETAVPLQKASSKAARKRKRQNQSRAASDSGEEVGRVPVHSNKFVL